MSRVLVDSNVLLDVLTQDPHWGDWSARQLDACEEQGVLAINPIIYAEVSVGFSRIEELDEALPSDRIHRLPLPWEAGFLAGKAFLRCRRAPGVCRTWGVDSENRPQRGRFLPDLQPNSSAIGQKDGENWAAAVGLQPTIRKSDRLLCSRTAPLPDFYIGAHAAIEGMSLLTRDAARYRTYYPKLHLICP